MLHNIDGREEAISYELNNGYLTSYPYIVVNDGWEENDVWIWSGENANDNSVDGCIYLYSPQL